MERPKGRKMLAALGGVLLASLLAACSSSAATPTVPPTAAPSQAGSSAAAATPTAASAVSTLGAGVPLTIWVNSADAQPLKDYLQTVSAATGHTLNIVSFPSDGFETALMQRWATGDRPDILEWHANYNWLVAINPKDNLRDLSSEDFVSRQVKGISASLSGATYGVVLNTPTAWGMFYNKSIFTKLGITPPTTADQLYQACLTIKQKDPSIVPMQESGGSLWTPLIMQGQFQADALQGGFLQKLVDRKVKVDDSDSPWLRSLQFYKKLQGAGCFNKDITTAKFENSPNILLQGKAAMVAMHSGFVQLAVDASNVSTVNSTIGYFEWSETKPVVTVEYSPNGTFYLPKTGKSDREAAALDFMKYMTDTANYAGYAKAAGMIPTFTGVFTPTNVPQPMLDIQTAINQYGTTYPVWSVLPGITDLVNYPDEVITGQLTPEAAVQLLQKEAQTGAKAANLPPWP